jgi:hypothetical protein
VATRDDGERAAVAIAGLIPPAFPAVDIALAFADQLEVDEDGTRLPGVGER